jgi:hypothetical protein
MPMGVEYTQSGNDIIVREDEDDEPSGDEDADEDV